MDGPTIRIVPPHPSSFLALTSPSLLVRQSVTLHKIIKSDAFNDLCYNSTTKKVLLAQLYQRFTVSFIEKLLLLSQTVLKMFFLLFYTSCVFIFNCLTESNFFLNNPWRHCNKSADHIVYHTIGITYPSYTHQGTALRACLKFAL